MMEFTTGYLVGFASAVGFYAMLDEGDKQLISENLYEYVLQAHREHAEEVAKSSTDSTRDIHRTATKLGVVIDTVMAMTHPNSRAACALFRRARKQVREEQLVRGFEFYGGESA